MCKCTPEIRTLFCGRGQCQYPEIVNDGGFILKSSNLLEETASPEIDKINTELLAKIIPTPKKERLTEKEIIEKIKPIIAKYVGDNVGEGCNCSSCEANREEVIKEIILALK